MPEHISSCLWLGLVLNRDVLEQWSPTPGPWTVRKQAVQQKVSSRQEIKAPSAARHLWRCNLNHLSPSTLRLEKLSSTKLVPGAKKVGDHCSRVFIWQVSLTMGVIPEPPKISVEPYRCSRGIQKTAQYVRVTYAHSAVYFPFLNSLKSLLNLWQCCFCFMIWFFGLRACGISAPRPGMKPAPHTQEGELLTPGPQGSPFSCIL